MRHLQMFFHQVLLQVKLEADRRQNYICKTQFSCPPCSKVSSRPARRYRAALLEGIEPPCSKVSSRLARSDRAAPLEVVPVNIFHQVLLQVKVERTDDRIISVKPIHPVRPARRETYTPPGGSVSLRPKGASPYVHREVLPTFGGSFSLHSKG